MALNMSTSKVEASERSVSGSSTRKPASLSFSPPTIPPLMSIGDVALILKISRRGVERFRSSGKFPRPDIQVGRLPRWKQKTVSDWIEKGGQS